MPAPHTPRASDCSFPDLEPGEKTNRDDITLGVETDDMPEPNPSSHETKLSVGQKLMIAALICLEIPFAAIFYPLATIIILTGVGAPISMLFWAIGTMPFALAMKYKATWQSDEDRQTEHGQHPRVANDDMSEDVPVTSGEPISPVKQDSR